MSLLQFFEVKLALDGLDSDDYDDAQIGSEDRTHQADHAVAVELFVG